MSDMSLFEIAEEYRFLAELAADPDADDESFSEAIAAALGEFDEKVISLASVARNLEAQAAQITEAAKAMQERAKRADKRAAGIREFILAGLNAAGTKKVVCPHFIVALKKSPSSVEIDDDADIPYDLIRVVPATSAPDKFAIKKAIECGREIPGVRLIQKMRLEIK